MVHSPFPAFQLIALMPSPPPNKEQQWNMKNHEDIAIWDLQTKTRDFLFEKRQPKTLRIISIIIWDSPTHECKLISVCVGVEVHFYCRYHDS